MAEILSIVLKIIFIVFFFGFCVFIHEFGHLLVALWQGLHVERFSIGMGPKMFGFHCRGVEYVVSWLPVGGYVSLPQLDPTDTPVTSDDKPLPHAKPSARAATAFAGPLFNILFGFVLAAIMCVVGLWRPTPSTSVMVAAVPAYIPYSGGIATDAQVLAVEGIELPSTEESAPMSWFEFCYFMGMQESAPSELKVTIRENDSSETREVLATPEINQEWLSGLRAGDRITEVNGKAFRGGENEFKQEYVYGNTGHVTLSAFRGGDAKQYRFSPQKNAAMEDLGFPFFEVVNPVQFAEVAAGSPAAQAGIAAGDQLLTFDGKNMVGPRDFLTELRRHSGEEVSMTVARDGRELPEVRVRVPEGEELSEADLGVAFYVLAMSVVEGSPAAKAGLKYGDRFLQLDRLDADGATALESTRVRDVQEFRNFVRTSGGSPLRVTYSRAGEERTAVLTPYEESVNPGVRVIGVVLANGLPKTLQHVSPWKQFTEVMDQTTRTLGLLFQPLTSRVKGLVTGAPREVSQTQIGLRHMSGPLGILLALWYKIMGEGYRGGFSFIILISFSLAFMNLLPLPVLDGGHILFAAVEGIIRRRIPATFFRYLYNAFAALLIGLMLYITFSDSRRIMTRFGVVGSHEKTTAPAVEETETPAATEPVEEEVAPAEVPEP